MSGSSRIFGLDLMRAWAIMSVVIGHGLGILAPAETEFPWIPMGDGVDMFFVLSGFLIGGILISEFVVDEPLGLRTVGRFWMRRWLRTLPNYYLILGANVLFAYLGWSMGNPKFISWRFLAFAQNLAWPFEGFFWESWSLAVEEWFYLSFPLWLLLGGALSRDAGRRKWFFIVAVALYLVVPTVLRITHFNPEMDRYRWDTGVRKVVVMRLDSIAYGLAMACISRWAPQLWRAMRWPVFVAGLGLFLFLDRYREPSGSMYMQVWGFSLGGMCYATLLPLLSQVRNAPAWLARPIRHVSLISYSMYLIHLALVCEVILTWFKPATAQAAWLTYAAYLAIVLVSATVVYYAWERPMMNLRDRWRI